MQHRFHPAKIKAMLRRQVSKQYNEHTQQSMTVVHMHIPDMVLYCDQASVRQRLCLILRQKCVETILLFGFTAVCMQPPGSASPRAIWPMLYHTSAMLASSASLKARSKQPRAMSY